jgi:hypothetical protein
MNSSPTPPQWAEALLRLVLRPEDFDTVSGDLLEEYRDAVHPARGQYGADSWYVGQVLGFLSRRAWVWGALSGGAMVVRDAFDWFVPPADFLMRSRITTAVAVGLLLSAGFWFTWRSGSIIAGALGGAVTSLIGWTISFVGAATLLAVWHDPQTMAAVRHSGGLGEVFTLPPLLFAPAVVLGTVGGVAGSILRRLSRS